MAWKDQLRQASFRGVPFFVENTDGSFGRRVVVHEFPQRAKPYAEDLGQKAREFSIDAFVIGDNYFDARDSLLDALNAEGPGKLVHPFLGEIEGVCTEVTVRESARDGGLARFSIKFVETSEPTAPAKRVDQTTQLLEAQSGVLESAKAAFAATWSTVGYATFVADKAVHVTEAVVESIEETQKKVRGGLLEIAELSFKIRKIRSNVRALAAAPGELAEEVDASIGLLLAAFQGGEGGDNDAAKFLKNLFVTAPVISDQLLVPAVVASQLQVIVNAQAMDNLVRAVAISYQAESLAERQWDSAQQAAEERDATLDVIDLAMESADDGTFAALQKLRVAITRAVPPPDATLAEEIEVYVPRTTCSLLAAYDTFGTIDNEADLIARNKIQHPGFIPAGEIIKALNG